LETLFQVKEAVRESKNIAFRMPRKWKLKPQSLSVYLMRKHDCFHVCFEMLLNKNVTHRKKSTGELYGPKR